MPYKCKICRVNDVDNQEDVCELCAIGQDPYTQNQSPSYDFHTTPHTSISNNNQNNSNSYAPKRGSNRKVLLNGGTFLANQDPYGNNKTISDQQPSIQVYSAGQVPQTIQPNSNVVTNFPTHNVLRNQPITTGITKNISVDNQKKSVLEKWVRALFTGIPFTMDDDVTMFQVFPDFSGTALNALGNACDQVIVYGKLNNGAVSENNDVEVYGRRDSNNNIIARIIKNKASGTTITPARAINQGVVWFITAVVIALLGMIITGLGVEGVIWTVIIILCLMNFSKVLKIGVAIFGALLSLLKRLF